MNGVASYILSVTAAAIVSAILLSLTGQDTLGKLVKLLAGIFMTLTVLSPILSLELPDFDDWVSVYAEDGQAAASMGEDMANEAAHSFIKSRLETYILDKAALYGASLTAEVSLNPEGIPVFVALTGDITPYAKARMSQIIKADLGLGEEAQQWHS